MASFLSSDSAPEVLLSNVQDLANQIEGQGGKVANVSFTSSNDGIGLCAAVDFMVGDSILEIPFSECISMSRIMNYDKLKVIFDEQTQLVDFPDEVLCVGIMHAVLHPDSCPWGAHVATWPRPKDMNSTIYWTEDELSLLKGTNVLTLTNMMKSQLEADWEAVHDALEQIYPDLLGGATIELYKWAISMVYSRAVGLVIDDTYERIIAPVLDMANHNANVANDTEETFKYDESNQLLRFVASQEISKGESCFALYGPYPNSKLAYTYGFVLPDNRFQAIDYWTKVGTASMAERKQAILDGNALTKEQSYDFTGTITNNGISSALMATLRIIQANKEELDNDSASKAFKGEILTARNEAACYWSLKNALTAQIDAEQLATHKEKLSALDDVDATGTREYMALRIVVDEKTLMQDTIELLDKLNAHLLKMLESNSIESFIAPDHKDFDASVL